ncbi:redoxin domain-containing protein [Phragmitibacter flavus]|uniref:Redoxin domain-containing protein n=1 Tax=Phragmitibacter flavus TaxID=2576071 RepID=A0A5R8KAL7_9BACT|nr:redoxin domain-containing protein [Phragmitibacter flavus]TLD69341.1 redoxin domain-containing protein [Phragmitibacter flavus]
MKKSIALLLSCWLAASVFANAEESKKLLNIGDAAPDFSLPGIDDKTHTLADYKDAKVLMIAFISNHCPTSQGAEARIKKLVEDYQDKGLQLVAINPNHPDALRPDELGYSIYNDGFEDMKLHAKEQSFNFPYLYDGETQQVARAYGCLTTPHVFIFDADRKLRYKGSFDDSRYGDPATVKVHGARDAVEALVNGKEVTLAETKPHGCATKWLTKKDEVAKDDEKWEKAKVDVEFIDAPGVAALRKNGTNKVRLINVWATWCSSCVAEFPELTNTARKFGLRDFEFISISLDDAADKDSVKAFLEKQQAAIPDKIKKSLAAEGRTTNSYIFKGEDQEPIVKALDPEGWEGLVVPHTVLVAPDGSVIWRHNGEIDGNVLREKILAFMGRHYVP